MNIVIIAGLIITLLTGIPVLMQILKNHPRGLIILFFAEMWERFSYYGMRGILVFYLTEHFLFSQQKAQGEYYASYTSLVYLLPLFGGILADRYLGNRKAIAYGALLLVAGHLAMAIEQKPARETVTFSGVTYQTEAQGRMEARQSFLIVDGERYAYKPVPVTALDQLPADASAEQRACAAPTAPDAAALRMLPPPIPPEHPLASFSEGPEEDALHPLGMALAKACNDAVVGNVVADDEPVAGIAPAQPLDRPARPHTVAVSVDQQRQQHRWRERRLACATDLAGRLEVAEVHETDAIHNNVDDVALG
jgi:hypothetical protein